MNEKTLSKRLRIVASFLPDKALFADIGSDHAYLPCYVCLNDPSAKAIAGEINEGPYQSAVKIVQELNLIDRIDVRKGDGLLILTDNEVEQVTIAGMGGGLIAHILESGKQKLLGVSRIIAQPNVDADMVRKWFYNNNFNLVDEEIVSEAGHIYEILVADRGGTNSAYKEEHIERQFLFGPYLLEERSDPFKLKWENEKHKRLKILEQMKDAKTTDLAKIHQFKSEIEVIQEVLNND